MDTINGAIFNNNNDNDAGADINKKIHEKESFPKSLSVLTR